MLIVDGGLGLELARRGFRYTTTLWSAEAILRAPEMLVAIHLDFLAAGANVIETATYQLSPAGLRAIGCAEGDIDGIFARAVGLAREAVAAYRAQTGSTAVHLVAASLGPYGATLGDGSEYAGVRHLGGDALYMFHAERARSVARAGPDVIFFETIPSLHEGLAIAQVARALDLQRVWLSFSCPDGARTYAGDSIREVAQALEPFTAIEVIGVNCTAPAAVEPLVRALRAGTAKQILACPNLGQHWENAAHELAGGESEAAFMRFAPAWLDLGLAYLGGCCGVRPHTIEALAALAASAPRAACGCRQRVDRV